LWEPTHVQQFAGHDSPILHVLVSQPKLRR
jgi:hypothetical protein